MGKKGSWHFSGGRAGLLVFAIGARVPGSTHASKMHALYLHHQNSLLRNSQQWLTGVASVGAAGGGAISGCRLK
jgi:hypothetical protein